MDQRVGLPEECVGKLAILPSIVHPTVCLQVPDEVHGIGYRQGLAPLANCTNRKAILPAIHVVVDADPVVG